MCNFFAEREFVIQSLAPIEAALVVAVCREGRQREKGGKLLSGKSVESPPSSGVWDVINAVAPSLGGPMWSPIAFQKTFRRRFGRSEKGENKG